MSLIDPPKRGRPKGSKTRPKWIRALEKQQPKRPKGRPPGSKNKPKTLEAWVTAAMAVELPPKPPPRRKDPKFVELGRQANAHLTPEERSERSRKLVYARKTHGSRGPGVPDGWSKHEYAPLKKEAEREARRIYNIMENEGVLPEDPLAREALLEALALMRAPGPKDFKHKVLRTILEYRLAKPTTKQDVTIRTAEDWLDEIAAKEGDEPESD